MTIPLNNQNESISFTLEEIKKSDKEIIKEQILIINKLKEKLYWLANKYPIKGKLKEYNSFNTSDSPVLVKEYSFKYSDIILQSINIIFKYKRNEYYYEVDNVLIPIDINKDFIDYKIKDNSTIYFTKYSPELNPDTYLIFIRNLSGRTLILDIRPCEAIYNLKTRLLEKEEIQIHMQKAHFFW